MRLAIESLEDPIEVEETSEKKTISTKTKGKERNDEIVLNGKKNATGSRMLLREELTG